MKKIILITALLCLLGCNAVKSKDIALSKILEEIKVVAEFDNGVTIDLKNQKNAAEYGIDSTAISEGYAYYSNNASVSDQIILVRAGSEKDVSDVEKAVSNELSVKKDAWKNNPVESKKIESCVLKTIDDCVILAIGDRANEIEAVFNQLRAE